MCVCVQKAAADLSARVDPGVYDDSARGAVKGWSQSPFRGERERAPRYWGFRMMRGR